MAFDIKYDRNGNPIYNEALDKKLEADRIEARKQESLGVAQVTQPEPEPEVHRIAPALAAVTQDLPAEEIAEPVQEESSAPVSEEVYQQAEQQEQVRQQKQAQQSFKELRDRAERLERERDEYQRKLEEAQASRMEEGEIAIDDDTIAEGKHLKKLEAKIKRMEQEAAQTRQTSVLSTAEIRLKAQYPDIEKVLTQDNINSLREQEPEIAESINSTKDFYAKAVAAYKSIKNFGIYREGNTNYVVDKARALQNASKPKPSVTVAPQKSNSPLSQAAQFENGLTPELKKQLHAEMLQSQKYR